MAVGSQGGSFRDNTVNLTRSFELLSGANPQSTTPCLQGRRPGPVEVAAHGAVVGRPRSVCLRQQRPEFTAEPQSNIRTSNPWAGRVAREGDLLSLPGSELHHDEIVTFLTDSGPIYR